MERCALSGTRLGAFNKLPRASPRATLTVRATSEQNRRQVLGGMVAGLAFLPATAATAASKIKINENLDSDSTQKRTVEAADWDEDIRVRRGELQFRTSVDATKARVAESKKRLTDVVNDVQAGHWTSGRNELRLQTGYLRYDLDVLVNASSDKGKAKPAADTLLSDVEKFDYTLVKKDMVAALAAYNTMVSSLDAAIAALG